MKITLVLDENHLDEEITRMESLLPLPLSLACLNSCHVVARTVDPLDKVLLLGIGLEGSELIPLLLVLELQPLVHLGAGARRHAILPLLGLLHRLLLGRVVESLKLGNDHAHARLLHRHAALDSFQQDLERLLLVAFGLDAEVLLRVLLGHIKASTLLAHALHEAVTGSRELQASVVVEGKGDSDGLHGGHQSHEHARCAPELAHHVLVRPGVGLLGAGGRLLELLAAKVVVRLGLVHRLLLALATLLHLGVPQLVPL
mmetsp:Transcript_31963/g.62397  ORF Transcript_31963/g.62397 Transcript_31963/m.62397 type:complete len:258 (+) Transcript_31963:334-1107(+)